MVQGFTRFRKIQIGKQSVIGTAVAATRVEPWRGLVVLNPNRTIPDVKTGTLDPAIAPYATAQEVTMAGAAGPLTFDDFTILLSGGVKGGVSPTGPTGGTAYTWTYTAASTTADTFDYYSVQTGDDTSDSGGSGINAFGGVIDTWSLTMDESLGPWQASSDWVFSGAVYGNRTGALSVSSSPAFAFGADTQFFLDSNPAAIGITPITDAVRGATLTVTNNLDQKRYANGSNTRFQLGAYGRGARQIELQLIVEKTAAMITEAVTLDDVPAPARYIKIGIQSTENAGTAIAYSANIFLPCRLFEVSEGEIGGNSNYTFTYRGFYDTTTYPFKVILVNKLSALP